MKKYLLPLSFLFAVLLFSGCEKKNTYALIETEFGNMKVKLYDDTPIHRDNFVKLVKEGFYDDLLFHRVIEGFMCQGGDPNSKTAAPGEPLGAGGPGYTLEAEIGRPHLKGALSAARQGDNVNPEKKSSGSQFFIVQGAPQTDQQLDNWEKQKGITYNEAQRNYYKEVGGYPFLDMEYTVFGEVVEGLDVIDKICSVPTNQQARPNKDIKMKISIL